MTPKEVANGLIEKYIDIMPPLSSQTGELIIIHAKKCANICVDEIIDMLSQYTGMHDQEFYDADLGFYREVKGELS